MSHLIPTYTLFAMPTLFAAGPYQGGLKGVTFIAHSTSDTLRWFTLNCGQLDHAFSELLSSSKAEGIMDTLRHGVSLSLPGEYLRGQFESGFHQSSPSVRYDTGLESCLA